MTPNRHTQTPPETTSCWSLLSALCWQVPGAGDLVFDVKGLTIRQHLVRLQVDSQWFNAIAMLHQYQD